MHIGTFAAHVSQDQPLVATLRELTELDATAMWSDPANHPTGLDGIIGIGLPHRMLEHSHRISALLDASPGPTPGRRQPRLRFARNFAAVATAHLNVARPAETSDACDTMQKSDLRDSAGKRLVQQPANALWWFELRCILQLGPKLNGVPLGAHGHFP